MTDNQLVDAKALTESWWQQLGAERQDLQISKLGDQIEKYLDADPKYNPRLEFKYFIPQKVEVLITELRTTPLYSGRSIEAVIRS